jgi:hypothetical protein
MRRVDRAIFAIFLLALVADVARSYASVPVASEVSGTLILGAASQLHAGGPADAAFSFRRAGSHLPLLEKRTHRAPVLAAWSRALLGPSAQWSQVAILQPASVFATLSAFHADLSQPPSFSSLAQIEHAGNPAP